MKRFSKAVALTVATGALVLGSATTALASGYDGGGKGGGHGYGKGYGKSYGKSYGRGRGFDGYGFGRGRGGANARAIAFGSPGFLSGNVHPGADQRPPQRLRQRPERARFPQPGRGQRLHQRLTPTAPPGAAGGHILRRPRHVTGRWCTPTAGRCRSRRRWARCGRRGR